MTTISAERATIDALDAELMRLIAQRTAVSRRIQKLRRDAGGPVVEHSREGVVVARWVEGLGRPGASVALALLELSRGPL